MVSPGELVQKVAEALRLDHPTVTVHDRNLLDAGLRSTGGRGRAAAKMKASDAAALLIALAGSSQVKDTVRTVRSYANLTCTSTTLWAEDPSVGRTGNAPKRWQLPGMDAPVLTDLPDDHTFRDALAALITEAASGSIRSAKAVTVRVFSPLPQADILIQTAAAAETHYYAEHVPDEHLASWAAKVEHTSGGLQTIRFFERDPIIKIGELLRT